VTTARSRPAAAATAPLPDQHLAGPALRAFFQIAESWRINTTQQRVLLGSPPASTYFKWKKEKDGALPRDVLERISYILGIYKALQILLPDAARADGWISEANTAPLFGGRSALDRMLGGNVSDLYVVRQYLDAERG
jgi:Protein of unknown function (DUF2384)